MGHITKSAATVGAPPAAGPGGDSWKCGGRSSLAARPWEVLISALLTGVLFVTSSWGEQSYCIWALKNHIQGWKKYTHTHIFFVFVSKSKSCFHKGYIYHGMQIPFGTRTTSIHSAQVNLIVTADVGPLVKDRSWATAVWKLRLLIKVMLLKTTFINRTCKMSVSWVYYPGVSLVSSCSRHSSVQVWGAAPDHQGFRLSSPMLEFPRGSSSLSRFSLESRRRLRDGWRTGPADAPKTFETREILSA